jgi:hypothetical protein
MKICTKCNKKLVNSMFYPTKNKKGLLSKCKICYTTRPDIICPICGVIHNRAGKDRRSNVCEGCYPKYRCAYNLIAACQYRAKKQNLQFDLDIAWILSNLDKCPKMGVDFQIENRGKSYKDRKPYTPSVDKIDPKLGYTKENCQVVTWWYNVAKQTFSDDELLEFCKKVVDNG